MNISKIERLAKDIRVSKTAIDHERILASANAALQNSIQNRSSEPESEPTTGRTILLNRITKLTAVAAVIVAVGVMYWLIHDREEVEVKEVEIPAALAQMPRANLFTLYLGRSETSFDREIVGVALRKSFDEVSLRDIASPAVNKAEAIGGTKAARSELALALREGVNPRMAVSRIVEECNVITHVRIEQVTADDDDLTAALLQQYLDEFLDQQTAAAEAEGVKVDRDDIRNECIQTLVKDYPNVNFSTEDFGQRIRATVQLQVIGSHPLLPAGSDPRLTIYPVLHTERIHLLEEGKEYLIALMHQEGSYWLLPENLGVFPVDPENETVRAMIREEPPMNHRGNTLGLNEDDNSTEFTRASMAFDEAWLFVTDLYDAIHGDGQPSPKAREYWLAMLQSEKFLESWTALEYFSTLRAPTVDPGLIMNAVDRHLCRPHTDYDPNEVSSFQHTTFLVDAIRVLMLVADEPTVDRMITLYEQDTSSSDEGLYEIRDLEGALVEKMLRLSLVFEGPKRYERFLTVFSAIFDRKEYGSIEHELKVLPDILDDLEGEEIDRLAWEMAIDPAGFGIADLDLDICRILWNVAALRASPQFGAYIEQALANPGSVSIQLNDDDKLSQEDIVELAQYALHVYIVAARAKGYLSRREAIDKLIEQHRLGNASIRNNNTSIVGSIAAMIEPEDTDYIEFFAEVLEGKDLYYDHGLVSIILTAERLYDPSLIGPVQEAIKNRGLSGRLLEILYASGAKTEALALALSPLEKLVQNDPQWRKSVRRWYEFEDLASLISFLGTTEDPSLTPVVEQFIGGEVFERLCKDYTDGAIELQRAAVLALGRLGGDAAILRLRELYASNDSYIRILSAMALYYLGDDTGRELVEHFVKHTERSLPDVEMHWDSHYGCDDLFRVPLMYLRSPRTDAILIESLNHFHHPFGTNRCGGNYGYGFAFLKQYKYETLPIIVEQLTSPSRKVRESANGILRDITGQDFGFNKDTFAGQQDDIIERWRMYINNYLRDL